MTQKIAVLGTLHELQGAQQRIGNIDDPDYRTIVAKLLDGRDFLFEEIGGVGPTDAERLAQKSLGPGRYLDVEPHFSKRLKKTRAGYDNDISDWAYQFVEDLAERETEWLKRIQETEFSDALLICGHAHTVSVSFKLAGAGYSVEKLHQYIPHHRLCRH
jgi:hypothetical protein